MSTTPPNITDTQLLDLLEKMAREDGIAINSIEGNASLIDFERGGHATTTTDSLRAAILASTPAASAGNLGGDETMGDEKRSLTTPAKGPIPAPGAAIPAPTAASETGSEVTEADRRTSEFHGVPGITVEDDRVARRVVGLVLKHEEAAWTEVAKAIADRSRAAVEAETRQLRASTAAAQYASQKAAEARCEAEAQLEAQSAALDLAQKALDKWYKEYLATMEEARDVGHSEFNVTAGMVTDTTAALTALRAVSGKGGAHHEFTF